MSSHELKTLLDQVADTREIVLRQARTWSADFDAWSDARDEALQAVLDDHDARTLFLRAADLTAPAKENLAAIIEDMLRETPDE